MKRTLVDSLLYEPENSGILWIKFTRRERMNALVGTAEENGTVAKVGEYMRAGDDDPNIRVIVLTGVGRGFCSGANLGSRALPSMSSRPYRCCLPRGCRMRAASSSLLTQRWRKRDSNPRSRPRTSRRIPA